MKGILRLFFVFVPLVAVALYIYYKKQPQDNPELSKTIVAKQPESQNKSTAQPNNEDALLVEFSSKGNLLAKQSDWERLIALINENENQFTELRSKFDLYKLDYLKKKEEAEQTFKHWISQAELNISNDQMLLAIKNAKRAISFYPSKKSEITKIIDQARLSVIKDMVTVPETSVKSFKISKYEVSHKEYAAFIVATGYQSPPYWNGTEYPSGMDNVPVFQVSYYDALKFAEWTHKSLPTEEQWEIACKFDDARPFPWGIEQTASSDETKTSTVEYTITTNKFIPLERGKIKSGSSKLGIEDLAGNVWEWTTTSKTLKDKEFFILKGGSYLTYKEAASCSSSMMEAPSLKHYDLGIRLVENIVQ